MFTYLGNTYPCLLYTSDAADEEDSVDLGGRRIIKHTINYAEWNGTPFATRGNACITLPRNIEGIPD